VEISQHALFIICDRHKLSGGDCWGPASECVCPCLKPKQSLLRHTHTHTQQHGDKQENPCPSSLSTILNQRIDPWRTHREFVQILADTHDTRAQIFTNRWHLVHLV